MTTHTGFAALTALIIIGGLILVGGAGYVAMNPQILKAPAPTPETAHEDENHTHEEEDTKSDGYGGVEGKTSIEWKLEPLGADATGMNSTRVSVMVNGITNVIGTFNGSCTEIGASGGIDGKGLLAGELSAVQCWYAGAGDEIGVFAHEDGGFDILVGELGEGEPGSPLFRGNFDVKVSL